jgi:hypothetical protein
VLVSVIGAAALSSAGCGGCGDDGEAAPDAQAAQPGLVLSAAASVVRVPLGDSAILQVEIERTGGLAGEVAVEIAGLPTGVGSQPATIPSGATSASLTVTAVG